MKKIFFPLFFTWCSSLAVADETKKFDFAPAKDPRGTLGQSSTCAFSNLTLPSTYSVLAAGAYSGRKLDFQIDQSGHEATRIDVAVNSPGKPVVLMLGAYEPTIWNIGWAKGTTILAVMVSGYHRQVVAGLGMQVPLLISTYDNHGSCGYFYVASERLEGLNPQARRLFGHAVDMAYIAANGNVVVGEAILPGTELIRSKAVSPESYRDKSAPLAGKAGLDDAVRQGLLRRATPADAQVWAEAVAKKSGQPDIPLVAGQSNRSPSGPRFEDAYVVLKQFTYPAGLYGAHSTVFIIPKGVPKPEGNPGHSDVYDLTNAACAGALCGRR